MFVITFKMAIDKNKPGFHKANFDHNNDQFWIKTKRLVGRMTAQPNNRFVFCVVVVNFAVNGNQAIALTNRAFCVFAQVTW